MVERNNDEERRLRIERTIQRLFKATAELEALNHPKAALELAPLAYRDPRVPRHERDHL